MRARDLAVLLSVILIVIMLIIPLPPAMLDFLIITNISLAILIILVAMNTKEPLQFSIFPTLLLLVTLFRLGLNVSTTRSILGNGEAGNVIDTFGNFVIGGNPLVGFVVFLILIIIQFIVITKGAERVSEVGARFTLDAMPGKQMSIDADLNAGMISDIEAKERREKIEKEADFYGAMDGASKFVKGDAIAGIVIVIINIIFGLVIGMMQMGMSLSDSANHFTLLTVGDGLVSQIPALIISTATGIIVTRAASDGNLGQDITKQLLAYPKMLYVASGTILALGLLTPISLIVTSIIAGVLAFGGYHLSQGEQKQLAEEEKEEASDESEDLKSPESVVNLLQIDPIEFEFGYGLIPLADTNQGGDLLDRVVMIRRQMALELGMVVPVIRIRDNIQLQPNEYTIKIKGNEVAKGELLLDHYMAMSPGVEDESVVGIETVEPAFGLPALWISEEMKEQAELSGYTVVDPPSVVSTHLTEVIKRHAHELIGRQETKQLVDHLKEAYPALVEEVTNTLSIGEIQKVLTNLLKEHISIRNLPTIFETIADYGQMTKDMDLLTEYVRQSLSRQISKQFAQQGEPLYVVTLSGMVEKMIADGVQQTEHGNFVSIDPDQSQKIIEAAAQEADRLSQMGQPPVILCSPAVRMYVRQLLERYLPQVPILSYNELEANVEVQSVGVVNPS
ncbi:flagellar biosynthesis protein FlhA [Halalkalibacterium halodurans]|uniref:Flagellar biosynthesis protein FlhA n=1 Tax=Halalkalibacterium halodurans (strain ATCC BAA-125 / DSM 18197 / FERM 7344 / JCM 9153 / C-125) TaxID=272558 RepID=Q9KA52_HALH5|nr:flagellar biosynthesis protein FlhA [Halalkalibacterium halodurans]MED4081565.1 flagellar biosynthesis protein FlhA [Halalkalibacterium halodurans]MED4086181.1 flagellar biosynthesis protein FlhA [Halalkalibacterium halodurans]MED4106177.1 flagellar biosynthesis protein FlhA [Halalkalibacterium halodurans]MED4108590.1 flagellar biosynthesis protein FlhA [Halalkalibacterium halodurans]MED4149173.1 flagellar biosynthesis protein FlhA [Halalkalibacterium halodurans]